MTEYTGREWKDHLEDTAGQVIQEGTPLSAKNLNEMEQGIKQANVTAGAAQKAVQETGAEVTNIKKDIGTVTAQLADTTEQLSNITVDVKRFGAKGDWVGSGTVDNEAIKSAIAYAKTIPNSTLFFPKSIGDFAVTETIYIPSTINLKMDGTLRYTGNADEPCLVIGSSEFFISTREIEVRVIRNKLSNWENEGNIGVKIVNADTCNIYIAKVEGFTIGVQCIGFSQGFAYNNVQLGLLLNNKIALDCTNEQNGWCNENIFINGRLTNTTTTHKDKSRYGLRMTSKDGIYKNNNNNVFLKPAFELKVPTSGEAIPIVIEHGGQNTFDKVRNETNSITTMRILNDSYENNITTGYGDAIVDDKSSVPSSTSLGSREVYKKEMTTCIYDTGYIPEKAVYYDGSTRVQIPGLAWGTSANGNVYQHQAGLINSNYLELDSSRMLGVYVDTSKVKTFFLKKNVLEGFGGRVSIRCLDAIGAVLDDSSVRVKGTAGNPFYFNSGFGGVWRTGVDSTQNIYFTVSEEVKRIFVGIIGVSNKLRIKSFGIYSKESVVDVYTGLESIEMGQNMATTYPTVGTWKQGKTIKNANPTPGSYAGWICVQGGTPGVWKGFGFIEDPTLSTNDHNLLNAPEMVTLVGCQEDETPTANNCTLSKDTQNFKVGSQGLKMTTTAAVTASARFVPSPAPFTFSKASALGIWVYIHDVSKVTNIVVTLYANANFSSPWSRAASNGYTLKTGWNLLRWAASESSLSNWGNMYRLDVSAVTTGATEITIGKVWAETPKKAKVIIVADGFYQTFVDSMYPEFKSRKIPCTFAINPNRMGETGVPKPTATTAKLDELYYDGNNNAVSFHSYDRQALENATPEEIRADAMRCIKWISGKGYTRGKEWRAAWVQDRATNALAAKELFLGTATYKGENGTTCFPPKDWFSIPRFACINEKSDADILTALRTLKDTRGFAIIYFHGLSTLAYDTNQEKFNYFINEIDKLIAENVIEFSTFDQLVVKNGVKFRKGMDGDTIAEYAESDGTIVLKRLP